MAVLSRKRKDPDATASGEARASLARAEGRGKRLKPTFVYEETFDTHALGERLLALTELTVWKGLALIAMDWAIIAATIAGTIALGAVLPWAFWPAWVVAVLVIGGRMHALLIIMHDASHLRLVHDRVWNDRLANWLCAYPALVSVESYRKEHLQHHFFVNSERDPNWITKKDDPEWVFPQTKGALALLFAKEFVGFGLLRMIRYQLNYGKHEKSIAEKKSKGKAKLVERLGYYALLAAALTASGGWATFALFWVVPLFSVLPAILRARILAEHHGIPRTNDLTHSRNYMVTPLERFFIAPHDIHLHIVHHLFPAIPCYNVARAHALLREIPEYRDGAQEADTILSPSRLSVLRDLTEPSTRAALAPA
jgi:fatty acid desaturase